MRRREFIIASRRRVAAWPLAARAQQGERMRRIGVLLPAARGRSGISGPPRGVPAGAGAIGLDHRPQRADRHSLGHGQCRRNSQTRGGIGRARAGRHPGPWHLDRGAVAAGDPHRADRVPGRRRSGRRRLRRQPGAAGRQRHRLHDLRIQHGREMAGTAQADRAGRDASGSPSGSHPAAGTGQFAAIQAVAPSLRVEVSPVNVRDAGEIERAVAAFARAPNGGLIVTASAAVRTFIAI